MADVELPAPAAAPVEKAMYREIERERVRIAAIARKSAQRRIG